MCVALRIIWPNFLRNIGIAATISLRDRKVFGCHFDELFSYSHQSTNLENAPHFR